VVGCGEAAAWCVAARCKAARSGAVPHSLAHPGSWLGENGERWPGSLRSRWQRALALADGDLGSLLLRSCRGKRNPKGSIQNWVSCFRGWRPATAETILRRWLQQNPAPAGVAVTARLRDVECLGRVLLALTVERVRPACCRFPFELLGRWQARPGRSAALAACRSGWAGEAREEWMEPSAACARDWEAGSHFSRRPTAAIPPPGGDGPSWWRAAARTGGGWRRPLSRPAGTSAWSREHHLRAPAWL